MTRAGQQSLRGPAEVFGLSRPELVLSGGALVLSAAAHLLPVRLRPAANLAIAALAGRWASAHGAGLDAQGMSRRDTPSGLAYGVTAGGLITLTMAAGLAVGRARTLYQSDHVVSASLPRAAYEVFLRIPLGTALAEEVVFRGALLGLLLQRRSRRDAVLRSSLVFGLWHVAPTLYRIEANPVSRGRGLPARLAWLFASVASTALSGLILAWLRLRSRSIVAPWLAHFAANAAGYTLAWLASRTPPVPARRS